MGHAEHEKYHFSSSMQKRAVIPEGKRMCPLLLTPTEEFPRELHHEGDGVHPRCHPEMRFWMRYPTHRFQGIVCICSKALQANTQKCLAKGPDSAASCCIYAECTNCMKSLNIVPPKYLNSEINEVTPTEHRCAIRNVSNES